MPYKVTRKIAISKAEATGLLVGLGIGLVLGFLLTIVFTPFTWLILPKY